MDKLLDQETHQKIISHCHDIPVPFKYLSPILAALQSLEGVGNAKDTDKTRTKK